MKAARKPPVGHLVEFSRKEGRGLVGLGRVDRPVLLLVGQREPGVVKESARELARALPSGEAMMATSVAHNWSLEMPGLFARAVRNWIEGLRTPPGLKPLE